jgi:hypothetical protein
LQNLHNNFYTQPIILFFKSPFCLTIYILVPHFIVSFFNWYSFFESSFCVASWFRSKMKTLEGCLNHAPHHFHRLYLLVSCHFLKHLKTKAIEFGGFVCTHFSSKSCTMSYTVGSAFVRFFQQYLACLIWK